MARMTLETAGEDVGIGPGQVDVYGTTAADEEIIVASGTDAWFDPSFNTGGDTIYLPGEAEEYTARREGSYVILESTINDVTVEIPVGGAGITIVFGGDDSRTLVFDSADGRMELDGVPIDETADPLPVGDDVPPPPPTTYTVLADSPTVTEGDSGSRLLTYTITLDQPAEEDVTITYTTVAGGTAEVNDDYQPVTGTVTIPAGSTTAFVSVPVFGDDLVEGDETINLQLSGPDLEATQVLTGTILEDDVTPPPPPPPVIYDLSINSPTVSEGDSGVRSLTYTVTLDQPADRDIVLTYVTTGGTATENDDYTPVTGTVTIPAGSSTAFISVPVLGDTAVEPDETVELTVSSPDASGAVVGTGTIVNDDQFQTQFNMQPGSETIIGTPEPDTFRASNNELGSGDYIDGRESTDTLILGIDQDAVNFFDYFGGDLADGDIDYRGFETDSVERILVTNDSDYEVEMDLSGSEGVQLVGSVNSSEDVTFHQVTSLADVLVDSITFSGGTDINVYYQADVVAGADDTVTVTVSDSDMDDITLGSVDNFDNRTNEGIENVNLVIDGDSNIDELDTELTNLVITGAGDLVIDSALEDTVRDIDATGLVGDLDIEFDNNTVGVDFDGATGDNDVTAGDGDDDITTFGGDDVIDANGGNDTVNSGDGGDTVYGDAGNDVINSEGGNDEVYGGDDSDTIDLGTGNNYGDGGSGDDYITATSDGVTLTGEGNTVVAGTGDDMVVLGSGNDLVYIHDGGYENVSVDGGDDIVYAGAAFAGDDSAALGRQDDILAFGDGDDWLYVDAGTTDLDYTNTSSLENLLLLTAGTTVLATEAQAAGITTIYGSSGNDVVDATAFTSGLTIHASSGSDTLSTGTGDDTFVFASGGYLDDSDVVAGGTGLDTINSTGSIHLDGTGFSGIDVINVFSNAIGDAVVFHNLGAANADENGTLVINAGTLGSDDSLTLQPTFFGVSPTYSLDVTGGAGDDYIETGVNDDDIRGGAGNDTIVALDGNDNIHGGAGDDDIDAGGGTDEIFGDTGADTIDLGADGQTDSVYYSAVNQSSGVVGEGRDTIDNFDSGEDQIDISELLDNLGITSTEFITAQELDAAEAQMVSGDGVYSIVFIENLPGEPTDAIDDATGFFFVDVNDDGELGGEDLQVFVNGENVAAGDVDTTVNVGGSSDYDDFLNELGTPAMPAWKMDDAAFA